MRCTRKRLPGELFASVWLKRRNQIREGRIIQETEGTIAVTEEAGITTIGETIIEEEDMVAAETGIVIEGTIADTTGEMVDIIAEVGETTMTAGVGTAAVEADMKTDEGEVMMIEEDTTTDEAEATVIDMAPMMIEREAMAETDTKIGGLRLWSKKRKLATSKSNSHLRLHNNFSRQVQTI
jgi:hypothetical protein